MASAVLAEDSSSASVSGTANDTLSQARNAALRLVSRAEQCTFLLTQKLLKKGFAPETVKTVVFELTEANIVNDGRFSQMWLRSRIISRADTPYRIIAALRAKGIDRNTAVAAVKSCLDHETESALLARFIKKRSDYLPTEAADCQATLRGEGFSQEAVYDYFESVNFE
ncbi:MAG: recombination regulator RecX [Spirochaetaceae bacterium]|jgi:regulatory protein|nr:recombination regulator RecX [Spirochaetaceae bacterium]